MGNHIETEKQKKHTQKQTWKQKQLTFALINNMGKTATWWHSRIMQLCTVIALSLESISVFLKTEKKLLYYESRRL